MGTHQVDLIRRPKNVSRAVGPRSSTRRALKPHPILLHLRKQTF